MKKISFSILLIVIFSTNSLLAQLGVGTITPDSTSMLDVTSTSKGLLAPRMTSIQKNAIASPANGLLVYDTDLGRFNYFNGTSWITIEANSGRDNYVIVKSLADLPLPVANVITLTSGILYEINGSINLGNNSIDLNGCSLIGGDPNNDHLIYTGSDALFSGSNGGLVQFLSLQGNTGATKLFNLNDTSLTKNLIIRDCFISNFSSVGTIAGFGFTFLRTLSYFNNSNGLIFSGATQVYLYDMIWNGTNNGTGVAFTGNFNIISMTGGNLMIDAGEIGVDVSSNPTINSSASIRGVVLTGSGTKISGYSPDIYTGYNFSNEWDVNTPGLQVETDNNATGDINLNSPVGSGFTTTFTGTGSSSRKKLTGTSTSNNLFRFTSSGDNRIVYDGIRSKNFIISTSISFQGDSNNAIFIFYIAKGNNGDTSATVVEETRVYREVGSSNDVGAVSIVGSVELSQGDFIEVWAERFSGTGNLLTVSLNLVAY